MTTSEQGAEVPTASLTAPPMTALAGRAALVAVRDEVAKAVVGQEHVVSGLIVALLCQGHVLLEGVPGVAKTLIVRSLGAALAIDTKRSSSRLT